MPCCLNLAKKINPLADTGRCLCSQSFIIIPKESSTRRSNLDLRFKCSRCSLWDRFYSSYNLRTVWHLLIFRMYVHVWLCVFLLKIHADMYVCIYLFACRSSECWIQVLFFLFSLITLCNNVDFFVLFLQKQFFAYFWKNGCKVTARVRIKACILQGFTSTLSQDRLYRNTVVTFCYQCIEIIAGADT